MLAKFPCSAAGEGGAGDPCAKGGGARREVGPGEPSGPQLPALLGPQSHSKVRGSPRCPRPATASPVPRDQGWGR